MTKDPSGSPDLDLDDGTRLGRGKFGERPAEVKAVTGGRE
jgi:hypothetical protein